MWVKDINKDIPPSCRSGITVCIEGHDGTASLPWGKDCRIQELALVSVRNAFTSKYQETPLYSRSLLLTWKVWRWAVGSMTQRNQSWFCTVLLAFVCWSHDGCCNDGHNEASIHAWGQRIRDGVCDLAPLSETWKVFQVTSGLVAWPLLYAGKVDKGKHMAFESLS